MLDIVMLNTCVVIAIDATSSENGGINNLNMQLAHEALLSFLLDHVVPVYDIKVFYDVKVF